MRQVDSTWRIASLVGYSGRIASLVGYSVWSTGRNAHEASVTERAQPQEMKSGAVYLASPGAGFAPSLSPSRKPKRKQVTPVVPNLKKANSHAELKSIKREMDRANLSVPKCIGPDICYNQGYLSGYTESASMWSFFTQWNEVLLRYEGTAVSRCVIEVIIATSLGFVCAIFALDDEWTPKRSDGTPFLQDEWGATGHSIVGSLLACACAGAHMPSPSPAPVLGGEASCDLSFHCHHHHTRSHAHTSPSP